MDKAKIKFLVSVMMLSLMSGANQAFVCHDSDVVFESDVIPEVTDITINYPLNASTLGSNVDFSYTSNTCYLYQNYEIPQVAGVGNPRVELYQGGLLKYQTSYSGASDLTNTTTVLTVNDIAIGNYNWSIEHYVRSTYLPRKTMFFNTTTYSLTVATNANEGADTGGACLTPYGYKYTGVADTGNDYVLVNLPNTYCVNVKCENAQVIGPSYYHYGNYQIVLNTTNYKPYNIYIGGFNYNYSVATRTPTPDETITLNLNNFTRTNNAYWIEIVNEANGNALDYTKIDTAALKAYCLDYSPDSLNAKTLNINNWLLTTKEQPIFELTTVNNSITEKRKQTITEDSANVTLVQNQYHQVPTLLDYYFVLNDFTGDYRKNGLLEVITNVNGSLKVVHSERWYYDEIRGLNLVNGSDYQVQLRIPNKKTINYGWITPTENGYKTLVATEPVLDDSVDHFEGLSYRLVNPTSYPYIIGVDYNFTTSSTINWINFTVYNSSGDLVHQTITTTPQGMLRYTLESNTTHTAKFEYDINDHSFWFINWMFDPIRGLVDKATKVLDLDGYTILGVSGVKIETFVAYFSLCFVALLATVANIGVVAILFGLTTITLNSVGYIPDSLWMPGVVTTCILVVLIKIHFDRGKK